MPIALPTIEQCETNKGDFLDYLFDNKKYDAPALSDIAEAMEFFKALPVFHHCGIGNRILYQIEPEIKNGILPGLFKDGLLLSNKTLNIKNSPLIQRTNGNDRLLGLDEFVHFSYGHPFSFPGPSAFLLAFSLEDITRSYPYPQSWFSWGDIITYAERCYGRGAIWSLLSEEKVLAIWEIYKKHVFSLSYLPEIAAYYSLLIHKDVIEPVLSRWRSKYFGYSGPEIKIKDSIPFKKATHCIIDSDTSLAARLASVLYNKRIFAEEPVTEITLFKQESPIIRYRKRTIKS